MKCSKATGSSGIIAEMLGAADGEGVVLAMLLAEAAFRSDEIPVDWEERFTLNLYKGKGEAFNHAPAF